MSFRKILNEKVEKAFTLAGFDKKYALVTVSNRPDLCQYQCNGCMAAAKEYFCEYVFIDTPGAVDGTLPLVSKAADGALIVTSHQPTTVRGAEKTGYQLEDLGVKEQYLVINRYDKKGVLDGTSPGLNWLIDHTHVPLIGVIPDSKDLEKAQIAGKLACQLKRDRAKARDAFDEVARRICGERIPIMSYLPEKKRRKLLYS